MRKIAIIELAKITKMVELTNVILIKWMTLMKNSQYDGKYEDSDEENKESGPLKNEITESSEPERRHSTSSRPPRARFIPGLAASEIFGI